MLCAKPYRKGVLQFGCGQCQPCRINRSRLWVGRMLLESYEHPFSCFTTLTYSDEYLPEPPWLDKRHLQLFLKKLRARVSPRAIRYYAVGEYGEKSWRPHYHIVLFGISPTETELVNQCWEYGFTYTGTAEPKSMSYVAQYVVKKMNNPKDRRLQGRPPEFCTMSLKPGIGYGIVKRMHEVMQRYPSLDKTKILAQVRVNGLKYPLGNYLSKRISTAIGMLPGEIRARLHTLELEKFTEVITKGTALVEAERKAKVTAAMGKIINQGKTL